MRFENARVFVCERCRHLCFRCCSRVPDRSVAQPRYDDFRDGERVSQTAVNERASMARARAVPAPVGAAMLRLVLLRSGQCPDGRQFHELG
jgi:hypothetical protein